ncbi:hypothetical protein [Argonema antarcticum]|uniref:hypothetical protein n=1 Tax=Argonema antarcticum TaxID=2942763 RepID=UPI002010F596|nr:hypothetical protein [Argonema antarcticum]MCL1475974.1 hypothetical protein [Argonema antarcticum A004/B2]
MLETKLTTCANLLYQWLLPRTSGGGKFTVDLQDFQAWTAEYRDKPFSDREIVEALRQLKELQLITVSRTEVTLEVKPENNLFFNTERPTEKSARPDRLMQLLRIISGSFFFGLISITFSLILVQIQPQVLSTPNQWSVFGESNSIGRD